MSSDELPSKDFGPSSSSGAIRPQGGLDMHT